MKNKFIIIIICILLILSGLLVVGRKEDHEYVRERVQNTTEFPYSAIARVRSGTGFFIGPHHVITAAHVVDDVDLDDENLEIYPGMNTEQYKPFNSARVMDIEIYEKYYDWWRIGIHDIAILTLDRNLGYHTGWFEIKEDVPEEVYTNEELNIAGYPNDPPRGGEENTMWTDSTDQAYDITTTTHRYRIETSSGHSGSPVWYYDEDSEKNYVLTVHTGSPLLLDFGRGARITESKYEWIREIMNKTSPPADNPDLLHRGKTTEGSFNYFKPNPVEAGKDEFKLSLDVKNAGTEIVREDFIVSFYLIENPPGNRIFNPEPNDFDYFLGKDTLTLPIEPFEHKTASWEGIFPTDIPSSKYYQLAYHIDEQGVIEEFDKTNNIGYFHEFNQTGNFNYFQDNSFLEINSPYIEVINPVDTPWPSFARDEKNTRRSPYDTDQVNGTEKWRFTTEDEIWSSPTIGDDGIIYIGSDDNNLYAINPNGTKRWKFETNGRIYSSPAIDNDGTIYIGSYDGNLYAINPDGTEKWRLNAGSTISSSPVLSNCGTIYVGSWDKNLYAINRYGAEKWRFETGARITSSPAIGEDGTVYVGSYDGNLYAVKDKDDEPEKKWQFETNYRISSSPAIGEEDTIYIPSNYNLYAVNTDGTEKWRFGIDQGVISSPAIGENDTIYIGSRDYNLYAINTDGTEKWRFETDDKVNSPPAIGGNHTIYVGSRDNNLYAINQNGAEKWRFETAGNIYSSVAIGEDGSIYVGSRDNNLYAIN